MNPRFLVQSLKGSKGQVLWAFFFAKMAMDVNDVIEWTGLKRETCYQSLKGLESVSLLGTQTLAHGRKVWLLGSEMLPIIQDLAGQLGSGAQLLQESVKRTPGALNVVDVESKLNLPTITTTTTTIGQESVKRTPGEIALIAKLNEHQITGRKRRELLEVTDREENPITPEYIQAHIDQAKADMQNWDNPVGVAINRMLDGLPAPELQENGRATSRYTGGKYGQFLTGQDDDESETS